MQRVLARWCIVPAMAIFLGMPCPAQARRARTRVKSGNLSALNIINVASHFICGNNPRAGTVSELNGILPRLGRVTVKVSASWDWSSFSTDHPAAMVDVSAQTLGDVNACTPFSTDATVKFSMLNGGGDIVADVVGGSVSQVVASPDPRVTAAAHGGTCPAIGIPNVAGTIDETIISFDADPNQADTPHGSISGNRYRRINRVHGLLRERFNSCTGTFDINEIIYQVEKK